MKPFSIRGFNPCESLLRHSPEQLRTFIRRMKILKMNTIIIHYDYGWKRYHELIMEECEKAGINIILMTFGPRTFLSYSDWKPRWFAKKTDGTPFTTRLECETYPCRYELEALEAYAYGARQWLSSLPPQIKHVHMRAADGLMFCQCEKCRILPDHEKWQPFVDVFTKAVLETRPDLKFETDIYVKRYNIPGNHAPFLAMSNIMYDTFYRSGRFPIGSHSDSFNAELVQYAATELNPDADTPNSYHLNRLQEWTSTFPGKVYIHENAMGQSLLGTFQYTTDAFLKDLEIYRDLGVQGVCYEAYEPGYAGFSAMFEILARAMNGEDVSYEPNVLEKTLVQHKIGLFCNDLEFSIEKYIDDPFRLKQSLLFRESWLNPTLDLFRRYIHFAFEHEARLDPLMIDYTLAQAGPRTGKYIYKNLSAEAEDFLHRRKLWDFMEDIPLSEDPRAVCRKVIFELLEKAEALS